MSLFESGAESPENSASTPADSSVDSPTLHEPPEFEPAEAPADPEATKTNPDTGARLSGETLVIDADRLEIEDPGKLADYIHEVDHRPGAHVEVVELVADDGDVVVDIERERLEDLFSVSLLTSPLNELRGTEGISNPGAIAVEIYRDVDRSLPDDLDFLHPHAA